MSEFDDQQKQWLQGFVSGLEARKAADKLTSRAPLRRPRQPIGPTRCSTPPRTARWRRAASWSPRRPPSAQRHPLDRWDEVAGRAEAGQFPKGIDVFLTKYPRPVLCRAGAGLLHVPAAHPRRHPERLAVPRPRRRSPSRFGGGYADVTTRANLQIREIGAAHAVDLLMAVQELGLTSRGSGADNIRNITGSPTAGIDPQELIDTRPLCQRDAPLHPQSPRDVRPAAQVQHRLRRRRPRRRRWRTPTTSASSPCRVDRRRRRSSPASTSACSSAASPATRFRPRHRRPAEARRVRAGGGAVVRVFIAHGDRTDRKKARLKYVLDRMGPRRSSSRRSRRTTARRCAAPPAPTMRAAADGRQARPCRRPRRRSRRA